MHENKNKIKKKIIKMLSVFSALALPFDVDENQTVVKISCIFTNGFDLERQNHFIDFAINQFSGVPK